VIKKITLIALLSCLWLSGRSQSIGLLDLINLTSLKAEQIDDYFISGHSFRYHSNQVQGDYTIKHYRTFDKGAPSEEVITGQGVKIPSGATLYTASYVSSNPKYIISLLNQTKGVGLKLSFQGADDQYTIYIYDSMLYHVVVKLNFSQTSGTVDVSQKIAFTQ